MNLKIISGLSVAFEKVSKYLLYLKSKFESPLPDDNYSSLAPIGDADKDKHYTNALRWALETRSKNDIRNIAITGPYGSGKSSVLKTFQNNYEGENLHFLNISLATFKEEVLEGELSEPSQENPKTYSSIVLPVISKEDPKRKTNSADLIRLIELSILQQIFYHADDSEIPDSRFKKIKRVKKDTIRYKSIATILFICSLLFLSRQSLPNGILGILNNINSIYLLSVGILYLLGTCYLLAFTIQKSQPKTFNVKVPITLVVVSLLLIFYVTFSEIQNWNYIQLVIPGTDIILKTLDVLTLAYVITFSLLATYNLLKYISKVSINKLKFQDTEIEIDSKINKSILNHHLDEILYFFEVTNYNVVIIEDLDRFQQTEIFTKLREINLLLNNSKKTKDKEIVFIYAVRDDIFIDKERSKFFDFIIPIIPVINSTNSNQKLLEKNNKFNYGWTEDLIDSLSIYIDDMRLLHNVCNEFEIYRNKLTNKLDKNKLLAIIVYKNLFPNDFAKLNDNDGALWGAINSKHQFISDAMSKIDEKIRQLESKVEELEKLKIFDAKELRRLYLSQFVSEMENLHSFSINNNEVGFEEMCSEESFNYLIENTAKYNYFTTTDRYYNHYGLQSNQPIKYKFEDIEKEVHSTKSYKERINEINDWNSGKSDTLRREIQKLEKQKIDLRRSKIRDILSKNNKALSVCKDAKQNKLVNVLLRHGYIEEDYHDFMSIFYEGSLTKADNDFLISVKNQESLEFGYRLNKIETLIKKIHLYDFAQPYILNYSLITFLLNNEAEYADNLENLFKKLKDTTKVSTQFVFKYIDNGEELEKFTNKICKEWVGIWQYIEETVNIPDKNKEVYFKHILSFADVKDITKLAENSRMKYKIENDKNFLSIIPLGEKLKEIISELGCHFEELDFTTSPEDLINYVYENWHYRITINNVCSFIKKYGKFDQSKFDTSNYSAIMTSECKEVVDRIHNNISLYIENVYLKIDTNTKEEEKYLIQLLNNEKLEKKTKDEIISKTDTSIDLIKTINDTAVYPTLLSDSKINVKWDNLLHAYNSLKGLSEDDTAPVLPKEVIGFINNRNHSQTLSETKTPKDGVLKSKYLELWKSIIHCAEIGDESYQLITKSCPWWYDSLNFENISKNKIKVLINNTCILPNETSYEKLKENHDGLNIYLLEKRKAELLKLLEKIQFDSDDIKLVLESQHLTSTEKLKILDCCKTEAINTAINLKLITSLLISNKSLKISDEILESILLEGTIDTEKRLKLFNENEAKYNNDFIENLIDSLDTKLSKINDKSIKAKIAKTETNKLFLKTLETRGYISSYSDWKADKYYRINHKRK